MSENGEMTEAVLSQAIKKIREYNMISNEISLGKNIGLMSDGQWNEFFNIMSDNGVYNKDLNWTDAYTLDFIKKGN